MPNRPSFSLPREGILDPQQLRQRQLAEAEQERFNEVADKIIELFKKENFQFGELSRIWNTVISKLGKKIEQASVDKILKLEENDKS
jgi:hypothetical protein